MNGRDVWLMLAVALFIVAMLVVMALTLDPNVVCSNNNPC